MLEDLLGWIVVLIGAVVMKFTDVTILDPLMSIGIAVFILINAVKGTSEALKIFLERAPADVDIEELRLHICAIDGVKGVHHMHVWSMDGHNGYATLHAVVDEELRAEVKGRIREELSEHGVSHATIELEFEGEECTEPECRAKDWSVGHHRHHHHHGHC
jgi:cobalt-zinc-cadmium efflux system protein